MIDNSKLIKEMLQIQNKLNIQISDENWIDHDYPWHRAVWVECAEVLQLIDWRWWGKKNPTMIDDKLYIELVDIWHFGMTMLLIEYKMDYEAIIYKCRYNTIDTKPTTECIESIVIDAITKNIFNINSFLSLLSNFNINIEKLYNLYLGKSILNSFRNTHGYKEGKYDREWYGEDDNKLLIRLLNSTKVESLNNALENLYKDYERKHGRHEKSQHF